MEHLSTVTEKRVLASTRIEASLYKALERVAQENDRTLSAEVRRAIRHYLEAQGRAA